MEEQFIMEIVMPLILHAGNAKSLAMESIAFAKKGEFIKADETIIQSEEAINEAHHIQTKLLQNEAGGTTSTISILLIHSQDHLMNAITVKDLAREFIDMYKTIKK